VQKGIGIDIIEIDRVKSAVKSFGDNFLKRIYTAKEISYCKNKRALRFPELAARFAAKEAYSKAIGTGMKGITWKKIEVVNDRAGKPNIYVNGKFVRNAMVSLSHSRDYASAVVLID
jgi:holo-[acyl-carrier protein] synthase